MPKLKAAVKVPVDFHTHCTPGYGLAAVLTAIIQGVDIVDTNIWWFGGGSAAPSIELIDIFCRKMGVEVEADMEAVAKIRKELVHACKALAEFDLNKDKWPKDFDEAPQGNAQGDRCRVRPCHRGCQGQQGRGASRTHATRLRLISVFRSPTNWSRMRRCPAECTPIWWPTSVRSVQKTCLRTQWPSSRRCAATQVSFLSLRLPARL